MSFEHDEIPEGRWRDTEWLAKALPIFRDLDTAVLDEVAEQIEWFALPAGVTLFDSGDAADAVYFVASGCLAAYATTAEGHRRLVGQVTAGETVGEMALISGRPRNASVVALRDTELGRLSREAFEALMLAHPRGLLNVSQVLVQRLESSQLQVRGARSRPKTIAVLPHDADCGAATFAAKLAAALEKIGSTELVWSQRGAEHTSQWFHRVERDNEFVVYVCDAAPTSWTKLSLRQADVVLLLARADTASSGWPAIDVMQHSAPVLQRAELVLLQGKEIQPGAATRWLKLLPADIRLHHVYRPKDISRVARLLTGAAQGVVLSGGGARGLAHIGVLRAIRERGVEIDAIAGTSIGAIVAAGFASQWSDEELTHRMKRGFVDTNPLNDYTIPFTALVAGRKVTRLLKREFADIVIEDLPLPFFCVSSNLTSGQLAIHRRGEVWRWLRASVAIPGVLPPVLHKGEVFVDGATINNLPVDVMRDFARGRVIGVDVSADRAFTTVMEEGDAPPLWKFVQWFRGRERRINILQVLWRSGMINSAASSATQRELSDLLLKPPLEQIDMLNWRAFDRAVDVGYRYAMERLDGPGAEFLFTPSAMQTGAHITQT